MIVNKVNAQISQIIKSAVINIYGEDNIKTAFITGSVAAGKARPDSDVDIFICYIDSIVSPATKMQDFISFYFNLHKQLRRTPDDISPGELLSFSELYNSIHRIQNLEPSTILTERDDFNAICWAGMLMSKRIILVPDTPDIKKLITISKSLVQKWAMCLEPGSTLSEATGEYTDIDKVLRRRISCPGYYDAH